MTTVAPALEAVIKNAGAPVAVVRPVAAPKEMPGERGLLNGIRFFAGVFRRGVDFVVEKREAYGDVHCLQFFAAPLVMVWDADLIHQIMQNTDRGWSTAMAYDIVAFERIDSRAGNAGTLFSLDFEEHRAARKLVQSAFTMKAIDGYLEVIGRESDKAISEWVTAGRVDFKSSVRTLLASIAVEIFTGITDPREAARIDRALVDFWGALLASSRNRWLSAAHRRSRRGFATLFDTFLALVPARRENPGPDLFSRMCQTVDEDGLGDDAIVRVFLSIMFAAFDTTSAALTSMAYLLAKHPEWQERLRQEALGVPIETLNAGSMKQLKEVEWAWKEALRLRPLVTYIFRVALRDVDIGGYKVRAGTLVMPQIAGIGHHPKWWKDPKRFDPERFSPERAEDKQHPAVFQPFGAGAHACVGMQLATMEMKRFWHSLLTRCSFTLETDYDARHEHVPFGATSGKVALKLTPLG